MKTKHKILSVLAIMAILAGLWVVVSAPASAATLTVASAKATPATVNAVASWDITLNTTSTYTAGDVITITFPTGVTMPATVSNTYVTVGGVAFATGDLGCSVSAQALQITINGAMLTPINTGAFHVVIAPAAGIKNPAVAKSIASGAYILKAKSTKDTTEGTTAVGFIPVYSISPAAANRYTGITVTGQGWTPSSAIAVQGVVNGNATADATGSFTATAYYSDAGVAGLKAQGFSGKEVMVTDGGGQNAFQTTGGAFWAASNAGGESPVMPMFTLLPGITVTPASGDVGSTVVVQGNDFSGTAITALTMGGVSLGATPALTSIDALGANDDFKVTVTVPVIKSAFVPMNTGAQIVVATDNAGASGSGTFTVNAPTVTISPASGGAGTLVTLTGTHFQAGSTITEINFGGNAAWGTPMPLPISGSGTWTYTGKVAANAPAGYNIITVKANNVTTTGTYFSAGTRSLTVTPSSGPLGTTVVLTGTNMSAATGANVVIKPADVKIQGTQWPAAFWTNGAANIAIDSNGNIQATTLQIPTTATAGVLTAGAMSITAMDTDLSIPQVITTQATATGNFTAVQPVLTITPTTGVIGTTISVVGSGFVYNDLVAVNFAKIATGATRVARPTVDASGAFSITFAVPYNLGLTLGDTCVVTAVDGYTNTIDQKIFTVSTGSVATSPASGPVGTVVTVTGAGLVPGNKISAMSIDGWDVTPDRLPQVAMDGTVTSTFTVPSFIGTGVKVINVKVKNSQNNVETSYSSFITVTSGTTGNTVDVRLAPINGMFDQVWTLDAGAWKLYDPSDVANAEFNTLSPGMAIYIHTTQAVDNVTVGGVVRNLVSGWNLIGWVS